MSKTKAPSLGQVISRLDEFNETTYCRFCPISKTCSQNQTFTNCSWVFLSCVITGDITLLCNRRKKGPAGMSMFDVMLKADAFRAKYHSDCSSCPINAECTKIGRSCHTAFLASVVCRIVDLDGNLIQEDER